MSPFATELKRRFRMKGMLIGVALSVLVRSLFGLNADRPESVHREVLDLQTVSSRAVAGLRISIQFKSV